MIDLNKKLKKVFVALFLLFSTATLYGQTVFTVDNTSGDPSINNSLPNLIGKALGTTGPCVINFNITGVGPFIINTTNATACNVYNSVTCTSLLIDATTQPGYVAGTPIVVLRGNGGGICFQVGESNLTIKGFVVQNYQKGFYQYGGNGNSIENCWFGVNAAGTSSSTLVSIKEHGIQTEPSANVTIGSKTDFTSSTRNIVSGCGKNGIFLNGASSSYVGNTFVGTDITGTIGISNGTSGSGNDDRNGITVNNSSNTIINKSIVSYSGLTGICLRNSPSTTISDNKIGTDITGTKALGNGVILPSNSEFQHGILLDGSQNAIIKGNVISSNTSGGIDIRGTSDNATITNNKIGTDITGNKPLGNNTFGIRIEASKNHKIGGTTKTDGNVISANGTNYFPFRPYNRDSTEKYDWYNSSGIYLTNTNNTTIQNNLVGVSSLGNSSMAVSAFDLGNFYCGIKIENGSYNVTVSNNIVSGNGFRSFEAYKLIVVKPKDHNDPLKGHGILIKDVLTTGNVVIGNYVGIGADGKTKIGNKEDGISIQGAKGTTIGGLINADRNVISGNVWGIKIASNYNNSSSSDINVIGNFVGTDAAGTAIIGNQDGGIGVVQYSQNTNIQGNVVGGNKVGISIGERAASWMPNPGLAPTGTTVYGNYIGVAKNGITPLINTENGIYLYDDANNSSIGGLAAGQANTIMNNGASGIYADKARDNNIVGNTITNNTKSGIILNGSINNILRKNTIASNGASGVVMQLGSNGNKLYANTIGDLATSTKGNNGEGIYISASANNFIGSVLAGDTNYIANNTGNGIMVDGATSVKNSFHSNVFSCNKLRGIELGTGVNAANANFQAPTFSGTATSLEVTGPVADSWIELYELDPCNNCATGTNNKLQGRKLVKAGLSPISYNGVAGVFYTATASESNSATVAHNTSAFSSCYVLCKNPNLKLAVSDDTVCTGNFATITIQAPELGMIYEIFDGNNSVSPSKKFTGTLPFSITLDTLLTKPTNILTVNAKSASGCTNQVLEDKPVVVVNSTPLINLGVKGDTICSNTAGNPKVQIVGAQAGVTYEAHLGSYTGKLLGKSTASINGDISIDVDKTTLAVPSNNVIYFTATIKGCGVQNFINKAQLGINSNPKLTLIVKGDTICSNTIGNPKVEIIGAESGVTYEAHLNAFNGKLLGKTTATANGNIFIDVDKTILAVPSNNVIYFTATINGCGTQNLDKQAQLGINTNPKLDLTVVGDTICSNTLGNPKVTISGAQSGVTYEAHLGSYTGKLLGKTTPTTDGDIQIDVDKTTLVVPSNNVIFFTAFINGCGNQNLAKQAQLGINSNPKLDLVVKGDTICSNTTGNPKVEIIGAQLGVTYEAHLNAFNGTLLGKTTATANGNIFIDVDKTTLAVPSNNVIYFTATINGCGTQNLDKQAQLGINTNPKLDLTVVGDTVCSDEIGNPIVTVKGGQSSVTYEAYLGSFAGIFLGKTTASINGDIAITISKNLLLVPSKNVIYFKAIINGCGTQNLDKQASLVINTFPKTNLIVATNSPVCRGSAATLSVAGSEIGKTYQVFTGLTSVSQPVPGNGGLLTIPLTFLNTGTFPLTISVSVGGCVPSILDAKPTFVVNVGSDPNLTVNHNGPICFGSQATVTILKTELGVIYQAIRVIDSATVSTPVTGDGGDKVLNVTLQTGPNVVKIKTSVAGCGDGQLIKEARMFVDTTVLKGLIASAASPICLGETSTVTILKSQPYKGYLVKENKVAVSDTVIGTGGTITIPVPNLSVGDHKFTISVISNGCKDDTLLQNPTTKVNSAPDATLKVATNGPVCDGKDAWFYVLKSEVGKIYQIYNGTKSVSLEEIGNGDSLKLKLTLDTGTYELIAKVTSVGCKSSVDLLDHGFITINSMPKTGLDATVNGPVCLSNQAIVTVPKAEKGKTYQVFYKNNSVSPALVGTGNSLDLPVSTVSLAAGEYDLSIAISVPGCTVDTLLKKPRLTINKKPDTENVQVTAVKSPICIDIDGAVQVTGIEPNVFYQAYLNTDIVSDNLSGTTSVLLPILASKLKVGLNNISVMATIAGCEPIPVKDTAGIVVNKNPRIDLDFSATPLVICEGGESILTLATSEAGVSYQAVLENGTVVSSAVLSNGGEVKLILIDLPQGINKVEVMASVGGCISKKLNGSVTITVNPGPTLINSVTGSTVCKGQAGTVSIRDSKTNATYVAFNKTTNTQMSDPFPGNGGVVVLDLFPSTNAIDTIIIKAKVEGCDGVRLDSSAIVYTNDILTSKDLETDGDTICINDGSAIATILKAKAGVSYQAKLNNEKFETLVGTGADLVFTIPRSSLVKGANNIRFTAKVKGCDSVDLANPAVVIVNDPTIAKNLATIGSTICVNDLSASASILKAISGVKYQVFVNNKSQPNILEGKDEDLVFNIARSELELGTNNVRFTAQIAGCTPIDLANGTQIIINDNTTSKTLPVEGSVVCRSNEFAKATIKGAKSGIRYDAYNTTGGQLGSSLIGDDRDLVFSIPVSQLNNGDNEIIFYASVAGCQPVKLDNQALIIVNGTLYQIEGDDLLCFNDTSTYSIQAIPGISKYNWKLPPGAKFLTDSTLPIIEVAFAKSSGIMEVVPEGSAGTCDGLNTQLPIEVLAPLVDTVKIIGTDTLCGINSKDWIRISDVGILNVDSIQWTWKGTFEFDSIYHKDTLNQIFEVNYPKVGSDTVIAAPYEKCSSMYKYSKSDTLFVTILGKPVAEAGKDVTITNDFGDVVLSGIGSSVDGQTLHDSITYNWSSKLKNLQILNPKTLNNASTVVSEEETKVYLDVYNHKRCHARDSATIRFESSLTFPNVFSPNNDGIHDTWEIKNLHKLYPNCKVEIFNKWGSVVYRSTGYAEPWDGKRNGEEMPVATYYYIVDLNTGRVPFVKSVTIIR